MKILVIGGTGIIGSALVTLLREEHEVIAVGHTKGDYIVDIENKNSLKELFEKIGPVDGIISTTGGGYLGPFLEQKNEEIDVAINSKLKGQIDLVRTGFSSVNENGFIILTTGAASHTFMPGSSSISMATAGLNAYVRAINIERQNGVRISAVSPAFVKETAEMMHLELPNLISAADTARVYKMVMDSNESGIIAEVPEYINSEK